MIELDYKSGLNFFLNDTYRYLSEIIALECNTPPVPRRIFADHFNPTVVMLVEEYIHGPYVTFSDHHPTFVPESLDWVVETFGHFTLAALDERVLDAVSRRSDLRVSEMRQNVCYVCKSAWGIPATETTPVKLTPADGDLVLRYPQRLVKNRPDLYLVFQWFVAAGGGEIHAIEEDGEILAYLSCCRAYERIWDVDYLHVRDDQRGRDLAVDLAAFYATERLKRDEAPYYSNVITATSRRSAEKAAFELCRQVFHAKVTHRKNGGGRDSGLGDRK